MLPGFIYLFQMGEYCKIGKSANSLKRIAAFQGLPFAVDLIHEIMVDDMDYWEKKFHYVFEQHHVRAEWFKLNDGNINWFSEMISITKGEEVFCEHHGHSLGFQEITVWKYGHCPCCPRPEEPLFFQI